MNYNEVLAHLDELQMHKIKLGLEAMQSFLEKVGRPESKIQFVHIAGTNGKGTVCAALSEILTKAGYRVGVFTSPHLSTVRERFRIGNRYIREEEFARLGAQIIEVLGEEQITYFEFTTALGLLWFAESNVDLVLLEVGMGGRLDATNVVAPLVCVITSISMDHEAYLGHTLAAIAGEKAGIIKPSVPVVSAATAAEAAAVVSEKSTLMNAPLYVLGKDFSYCLKNGTSWSWMGAERFGNKEIGNLPCRNPSLAQQENESLAVAVSWLLVDMGFDIAEDHIREGLSGYIWPGRMEYFEQVSASAGGKKIRYLIDGAHNPAGVKNLSDTLAQKFSNDTIIGLWGSMIDKDLTSTLNTILPHFSEVIITRPEGERSARPEQIFALLTADQKSKAHCISRVDEALKVAQEKAGEKDLIVVGGSLYLIGAIRYLLVGHLA